MGLKDLVYLKPSYDSDKDDVLNEFYVPILNESVDYFRLAGFFSSTSLAVAARGIKGLLKNDGKIKLISGAILQKEDINAIKEGLEYPRKVIERNAIIDLENIQEEFIRNHIRALGWLVAKNKLDIRIAIMKGYDGQPADAESIIKSGIYHQKVGIFADINHDMISFSGSVNETARAWCENIEEFKIFRSWKIGEQQHFLSDFNMFNKYWNGESNRVEVIDVPDAVKRHLVKMSPENIDDLNLNWISEKKKYKPPSWLKPKEYQDEAVQRWLSNGKKGMLEMATGTGKTIVALKAACKYLQEEDRGVIIVSCPMKHLVRQWAIQSENFNFRPLLCYIHRKSWEDKLNERIIEFNNKFRNFLFIITTHDTFISEPMQNAIERISGPRIMLIADEVHHLGASRSSEKLPPNISARMGLSATPDRFYDPEGSRALRDYFGNTVFEYSLKKAIKDGHLCRYRYFPHIVELGSEEIEDYLEKSREIGRRMAILKNKSIDNDKKMERLLIERSAIINRAIAKIETIRELVKDNKDIDHALFYCDPKQLLTILNMLGDLGIDAHRFTNETSDHDRDSLLINFDKGYIQALVAIRCLDEGVDVPGTRIAYFLASSSNPVQFVQRRGRILRTAKDKEEAIIHDLIVVPYVREPGGNLSEKEFNIERKILKRELVRFKEFADASENYFEANAEILSVTKLYNIMDF